MTRTVPFSGFVNRTSPKPFSAALTLPGTQRVARTDSLFEGSTSAHIHLFNQNATIEKWSVYTELVFWSNVITMRVNSDLRLLSFCTCIFLENRKDPGKEVGNLFETRIWEQDTMAELPDSSKDCFCGGRTHRSLAESSDWRPSGSRTAPEIGESVRLRVSITYCKAA